jgi:hypothetical protein
MQKRTEGQHWLLGVGCAAARYRLLLAFGHTPSVNSTPLLVRRKRMKWLVLFSNSLSPEAGACSDYGSKRSCEVALVRKPTFERYLGQGH